MIQAQLKLRIKPKQEAMLNEWLWILTGVHNWAVKKIENDAKDGIYYTEKGFQNLLADHGKKIGIPSHTVQGVLLQAHATWKRCFKKIGGKPKLKGNRNKLISIPFPDPIKTVDDGYIRIPVLGLMRFHKHDIPVGKVKCARIIKRASGWYVCLFIDAERKQIERKSHGMIGIDPGYSTLLTLSTGEKISHPRELEKYAKRLAQAQRGNDKKLASRIQERIANRRKDRNHKLSLRLIQENVAIAFSKDNIKGLQKIFGKSVASSGHGQLRSMLLYKGRTGGTDYREPSSRKSTMTCSSCLQVTGPTGWAGLKVRKWVCSSCGEYHDRDINSGKVTLIFAFGTNVERYAYVA